LFHDEKGMGFLVGAGYAGGIATAFAGDLGDEARRTTLEGASERAAAGSFSWEIVARRHEEVYRELVS
jgi:hypothetical protein